MKRLSLTLLCSAGLLTTGCFNKDKSTTDPSEAAGQNAGEGESAPSGPSRASGEITTRRTGQATKGRIKTFEAPAPVREVTVVPGTLTPTEKLEVGEVRPSMAPGGSVVEIFGSGFGEDPSAIKVLNGRNPWTVKEVYADRIVAEVTGGGGAGNLSVQIGKSKGTTTNKFTALDGDEAFESASSDLHGLIGTVYRHGEAGIPDFSGLEAIGTIALAGISIDGKPASDFDQGLADYAIRFAGSVNVTAEGEYDLCLGSSGASRLLIMDTLVVDNESGGRGCELVYLEAGEYDLAVEFVNYSSAQSSLELMWAFDGGGKEVIPANQLFRP